MLFDKARLEEILKELDLHHATLVAVSKTKSQEAVKAVYDAGHKIFGENYVRELNLKAESLPDDIRWHFIGHLQSNKVKQIVPFVSLIQGVDSMNLLKEIDKQAKKSEKIIDCLLQIHIAKEETKFGLSFKEADLLLSSPEFAQFKNICIKGLMGMASLTDDMKQVRKEFHELSSYFEQLRASIFKSKAPNGKIVSIDEPDKITPKVQPKKEPVNLSPHILSMGMTGDYKIALAEGSNMVRIGSAIFGERA